MPSTTRPSYFRSLSSYTSKDKPRLYIALYPRSGHTPSTSPHTSCDSYHWALLIGSADASRKGTATRFHLAHSTNSSSCSSSSNSTRRPSTPAAYFEESTLHDTPIAQDVLIRVAVAKIADLTRTLKVLRSLRAPTDDDGYTCLHWVQDAFAALHAETGCLKSYFDESDWMEVEVCAREYCRQKRLQRRFAGGEGPWKRGEICTFNAWENRETTP